MEQQKAVRVLFRFGNGDEDQHEVRLQIAWQSDGSGAKPIYSKESLNVAVQHWVAQHVSYTWQEVEPNEEEGSEQM